MRVHLFAFTLVAVASGDAVADPSSPPLAKTIGIDGGIALPTGTWSDGVGFGIGSLARFELGLAPAVTLSARAGYIQHLSKDQMIAGGGTASASAGEIPFFAGARYAFTQGANQIYAAAELGLVVALASVDYNGMSMSNSQTNVGMTVGGGYRAGRVDVRGGLFFPDLGHAGDAIAVMATVGFDIASL